jgi:leader peptidase (prepilin peptidase)/N-methyltransferase
MMIEILNSPPETAIVTVVGGVIGLLVGSFLNVVIHRIPKMMQRESDNYVASETNQELPYTDQYNLIVPRSACPQCGHQISAWENIPVISYLLIGGKCKQCKSPISARYPIVESITALFTAFIIWRFGSGIIGLSAVLFTWLLIAMTFIDIDTQLLPDDLTLSLLWCGLLVNMTGGFVSLDSAVLGAVFGYFSLWSVYWIFKLVTGKEGMGYGDFKLLAALGAWMGWTMLPLIILLSSLVGAVVGISMIVFGKMNKNIPIPFGPYLAGAGFIALVWGQTISVQYLGLLR